MGQIELVEVQMKYANDIWSFRQEILECDAEMKPARKQYLPMAEYMRRR